MAEATETLNETPSFVLITEGFKPKLPKPKIKLFWLMISLKPLRPKHKPCTPSFVFSLSCGNVIF